MFAEILTVHVINLLQVLLFHLYYSIAVAVL